MKIAVEGCAHGELDKIYEAVQTLEGKNKVKIDLLIICGDFQAVRNPTDLKSMAVPIKYRKMNTFYKYYSGEKKAPILTIFIGGNHEASNYLSELSYGGWVCPNIYYMGYANVINIGGLRIAGLSGIYKGHDYLKGHFESPPYDKSTVKSVYHVRNVDVFRLKQIKKPIDICISHDWPRGVYQHGNLEQLLRFKPFFKQEMESNKLGSQPAEEILAKLKPSYWFAAHLHCKFTAVVPHSDTDRPFTKFLALDKCLPKRRFLQVLEIGEDTDSVHIEYDPEWLCILRNTNHLLNVKRINSYMPGIGGNERYDFTPTEEEINCIKQLLNGDLNIPENFCTTAPIYLSSESFPKSDPCEKYLNPQTQSFCKLLFLTDPNEVVSNSHSFNTSSNTEKSMSDFLSSNLTETSTSDEEKEASPKDDTEIEESAVFYIDRVGSTRKSNTDIFLETQFYSSRVASSQKSIEVFPEIKEENMASFSQSSDEKQDTEKILFKRRNRDLYSSDDVLEPTVDQRFSHRTKFIRRN